MATHSSILAWKIPVSHAVGGRMLLSVTISQSGQARDLITVVLVWKAKT